ncbi:MAG: glycoside hydrolase family 3 N-terminal domain-containing protein, partial [Steroidobacteraceae bacterium]
MSHIDALIGAMTLDEKLGQLTMTAAGHAVTGPTIAGDSIDALKSGTVGNVLNLIGASHVHEWQRLAVEQSRLHIPVLFALDVIHGHRTLFPVSLAEASLFDPRAWELSAREAAREAAADGIAMTFAPMLDVARDPRWGRMVEGPGEDPWVGVRMAEAKVRGFQGAAAVSVSSSASGGSRPGTRSPAADLLAAADTVAACAKHYCGYGAVMAGREYASVDISERTLREVHLPPFEAAVRAGVAAIMPAFTELAGIPMTAHTELLRGWLRGRLGFRGVVVSDYNAVAELIRHGVAADAAQAAALALKAGVDIDMMAGCYRSGLPVALERGLVTLADIDESVRRVLELKERLGLFEDPYRRGARPEPPADVARRRQIARAIAARAIVMLTNERRALPFGASVRTLALIGPLADASAEMRGPWWAAAGPEGHVTVLEGLRAALPDVEVRYAPGVAIESADTAGIGPALELCDGAEAVVLCLGEAAVMSGEAASRAHLGLPGAQRALAEALLAQARASGKPSVAVLFSGRPLIVPWLVESADAVLAAGFLGSEAGSALADVMTGRVSPSGRVAVSWPRALGQVPLFHGERPSGRPANPADHFTSKYLDVPNEPLFAFGHGLSYGNCVYSDLRVTPDRVTEDGALEVRVDVENAGPRSVEETVFLFVHDPVASVSRPTLELKDVQRIELGPGERGLVTFRLPAAELRFLDAGLEPVFEPGEVEIRVG